MRKRGMSRMMGAIVAIIFIILLAIIFWLAIKQRLDLVTTLT